ncbi:hypothetical protein IJI70_01040 [Candidatus Saccharibacteria bacterium]|nr:hypothetical protein [Candidatus Saccharibacteria bacterium]
MNEKMLRGDTLVEVMFAVGIFGIVAVSAISLMNRGVNNAQAALETTMARNEIDAQAEALRFIHDAYAAEKHSSGKEYSGLWEYIKGKAAVAKKVPGTGETTIDDSTDFFKYPSSISSCSEALNVSGGKVFAINTHNLGANAVKTASSSYNNIYIVRNDSAPAGTPTIKTATTYPRLVFADRDLGAEDNDTNIKSVEGIWITAVKPETPTGSSVQYYDFYIRTCWDSPGRGTPITISTTIRLYNPDI